MSFSVEFQDFRFSKVVDQWRVAMLNFLYDFHFKLV